MSFNAIRENKILAKISEFTILCACSIIILSYLIFTPKEKNYADVRSSASRKPTPLLPPDPAPDYRTDDKYTPLNRTVSRGRPQSGQNVQRQSDGGMDRQTMERLEKLSARFVY